MREDDILLGQIEDKIAQCENKYIVTHTGFLDSHQQSVARIFCGKNHIEIFDAEAESAAVDAGRLPACRTRFYGGYEDVYKRQGRGNLKTSDSKKLKRCIWKPKRYRPVGRSQVS